MAAFSDVEGGVCAVGGVRAAGIAAGLKPGGAADVALVDAGRVVAAAGVQTRNQVVAAPVVLTRRNLADGHARAVLLNAGGANACTGAQGLALAEESTTAVAELLGCDAEQVLVASTGVIGQQIPREPFLTALPLAVEALGPDGGTDAATAIMTTDTVPKEVAVRASDDRGSCVVGGMVKGAGMIAPEMATMLCVITTDAAVDGAHLQAALDAAVRHTFNRVSVDACMSTNDAVLVLATGGAPQPPGMETFAQALETVCGRLAEWLVRDGEGATRLVRVRVAGAGNVAAAEGIARAVTSSALFRSAMYGGDPNWGRVLAAMGAGPVRFDPDRVAVSFGGVTVARGGVVADFDLAAAEAALQGPEIDVGIDVGAGAAEATFLTCDLSHEYVTINAEYTT